MKLLSVAAGATFTMLWAVSALPPQHLNQLAARKFCWSECYYCTYGKPEQNICTHTYGKDPCLPYAYVYNVSDPRGFTMVPQTDKQCGQPDACTVAPGARMDAPLIEVKGCYGRDELPKGLKTDCQSGEHEVCTKWCGDPEKNMCPPNTPVSPENTLSIVDHGDEESSNPRCQCHCAAWK